MNKEARFRDLYTMMNAPAKKAFRKRFPEMVGPPEQVSLRKIVKKHTKTTGPGQLGPLTAEVAKKLPTRFNQSKLGKLITRTRKDVVDNATPAEAAMFASSVVAPIPASSLPAVAGIKARLELSRAARRMSNRRAVAKGKVPKLPAELLTEERNAKALKGGKKAVEEAWKRKWTPSSGYTRKLKFGHVKQAGIRQAAKWMVETPGGRAATRHGSAALAGGLGSLAIDSPDPAIGVAAGMAGGLVAGAGARQLMKKRNTVRKGLAWLKQTDPTTHTKTMKTLRDMREGADVPAGQIKDALKSIKGSVATVGAGALGGAALGGALTQGAHQRVSQYKKRRYGAGYYGGVYKNSSASVDTLFDMAFDKTAERKGHWRELKPGQEGEGKAGEKTKGRTWVDETKAYAQNVKKLAPGMAVKQIADFPKGTIEGRLKTKLLGNLAPPLKRGETAMSKALWKGGKRWGAGTAVGIGTGPLFISGLKQAGSEDKKERRKGYAKVLGAGSIYSGLKGAGEFASAGKGGARKALGGGVARLVTNIPAVLGTAYGVSASRKKKEEGDDSKGSVARTVIGGGIGGAAGGLAKGVAEVPLKELIQKGKIEKHLLRRMKAGGLSRAAGGAAGGAILGTLLGALSDRMEEPKKEKSAGRLASTIPVLEQLNDTIERRKAHILRDKGVDKQTIENLRLRLGLVEDAK